MRGRRLMKRTAVVMAMAMAVLVSAGVARAQETVSPAPASPIAGGKVIKSKTMTAVGEVKAVTENTLDVNGGPGNDWTVVIDAKTKITAKPAKETVDVGTVSPVEGGKQMPSTAGAGQEKIDVAPVSPVEGGKVIPTKKATLADIKEGQRVQ